MGLFMDFFLLVVNNNQIDYIATNLELPTREQVAGIMKVH